VNKKNKNKIFHYVVPALFLVGVFFLLWRGTSDNQLSNLNDIKSVKIAGRAVSVELAITAKQKMQGLSSRLGLKDNAGMLFVFHTVGKYPFWMKDMKFPIDIIWINGELDALEVVYIEKNAKPESFPNIFGGTADSKYVLEVNAGFSEKNSLKVGDKIKFLP